ncbi:hypothetical protein GYMLUDRAFT_89268 [Collybiopsis luxurians FD-317 M1]|uniref:BTB domain-containing protein n=1 Tax=Collybiopsis luxurians FD-317 M1 TaxID=944289 RepID=A0A0D0BM53_9AGAR|nr:hypothetical protein GYMLUDRAFT_89268 [Collybiopsis luxurians FD-317 M1]
MATPVPEIQNAKFPFHDDPSNNGDQDFAVLRSSDLCDFLVYKPFLCFAKDSFFRGLFSGAQALEYKNGLPVARLEEKSDVIRDLLLLCYPGKAPTFEATELERPADPVKHIVNVLRTAEKYCLMSEELSGRVDEALMASPVIEWAPYRVYAIGVRYRLKSVCLRAAKNSLAEALHSDWADEMNEITAMDLLALQSYQNEVKMTVRRFYETVQNGDSYWIDARDLPFTLTTNLHSLEAKGHSKECIQSFLRCDVKIFAHEDDSGGPYIAHYHIPTWFDDYINGVATLCETRMDWKAFTNSKLISTAVNCGTKNCPTCLSDGSSAALKMAAWAACFHDIIQSYSESKVPQLKLTF